jgi:transcriptional regulator of acetoin/glycerol metabolism
MRAPDILDLEVVVHSHILHVLDLNRGNKLRTARQLGISRSTLYRLLDKHVLFGG